MSDEQADAMAAGDAHERVVILYRDPEQDSYVGVTVKYLHEYGPPMANDERPMDYHSVQIVQ